MAIPPQPTPFASFDITLNDSPYNGIIRANQIARSPPTDYLVRTSDRDAGKWMLGHDALHRRTKAQKVAPAVELLQEVNSEKLAR
eukprot:1192373-Prorocentrum_minimum.AAC.1